MRDVAVVDALDLVVDEVERQLDERLRLRRNAAVALRVTSHRKPNASTPRTIDVTTVSTLTLQKSPVPTGFVRNVR